MKFIPFALILISAFIVTNSFAQKKKTSIASKQPIAILASHIISGKKVFTLNCLVCHQADGLGLPNMYPPLSKTTYVLGDKQKLIKIPLGGFSEQIEINGEVYTNAMPSFGVLTDKEIADVLTYVRNSFGNKAGAVTAAEVKKARAAMRK